MTDTTIGKGVVEVEMRDTGVEAGVARIEKSLDTLGVRAKAAGQTAADGVSQIPASTESAEKRIEASTRSIANAIQRQIAMLEAGNKTTSEYYTLLAQQRGVDPARLKPYLDQLDKANASQQQASRTSGEMSNAMRTLPAQFTDIATSLAGGQDPMLVFIQQGGQLKDMFGGAGPAAKAMGQYIMGLVTPYTAAAAAVALIGAGFVKAQKDSENFARSLLLSGNAAGATKDRLREIVAATRDAYGLDVGSVKDVTKSAVASGAFGPSTLKPAIEAMSMLQNLSGKTADEVVKDFSGMRAGAAKWAADYATQYGLISTTDLKHISDLERTQDTEAAMQETIKLVTVALRERLGVLESEKSVVTKITEGWGMLFATVGDKVGKAFATPTQKEKLGELKEQLKEAENSLLKLQTAAFTPEYVIQQRQKFVQSIRDEVAAQERAIAASEHKADADAKAADAMQRYKQAMSEMPQYQAANTDYESLIRQQNLQDKLALNELNLAALQGRRNAGLITETEYLKRQYDLRLANLKVQQDAAKTEMERQGDALKKATINGDLLDRMKALKSFEGARQQYNQTTYAIEAAKAEGSGDTTGLQGAQKVIDLTRQYGALAAQLDYVRKNGVQMADTLKQTTEYDLYNKNGALFGLDDKQKTKIMDLVKSISAMNQELKDKQALSEYEKRTKMIIAEAEAVGMSVAQKRELIAAQELENQGIRRGTPEFEAALKKRLAGQAALDDAQRSAERALSSSIEEYSRRATDGAAAVQSVFGTITKGMEDNLTQFFMTGKAGWKDFANSVVEQIVRIQMQKAIAGSLDAAKTTSIGQAISSFFASANGNAFVGGQPLTAFANGGAFTNTIAKGPTIAPMALFGEAGPEAIMPLARDSSGRLGVRSSSEGTQAVAVSVNVTNASSQPVSASASQPKWDGKQWVIGVVLEDLNRGGPIRQAIGRM